MATNNKSFNFETFPWIPVSVFAVVALIVLKRIPDFLRGSDYQAQISDPVAKISAKYTSNNSVTADGHFVSGAKVVTVYTISQARSDAESLASLLKKTKGAATGWFDFNFYFAFSPLPANLKKILDPGFPVAYRRYVVEVYRDVFTDKRSLSSDVRSALTGFAGSSEWDNNLTKYFII